MRWHLSSLLVFYTVTGIGIQKRLSQNARPVCWPPRICLRMAVVSLLFLSATGSFVGSGTAQTIPTGDRQTNISAAEPDALAKDVVEAPGGSRYSLKDWDTITGIAGKLVQITALIVGGLFAYLKFFKGRTYRPRLELTIRGILGEKDGIRYLVPSVTVKNIGLAKCGIRQTGSGIRISDYQSDGEWGKPRVVSILTSHEWIESGETVSDEILVPLEGPESIAYMLELRLVSEDFTWMRRKGSLWMERTRISWLTRAIVGSTNEKAASEGAATSRSKGLRGKED